jgi:hypothetical protein
MKNAYQLPQLAVVMIAMMSGCDGGSTWWADTRMWVEDVQGDQVWFLYDEPQANPLNPWTTFSLGSADLASGEVQHVRSGVSGDIDVEGEFLVARIFWTDEASPGRVKARIVAVRMSTGEEITIHEAADFSFSADDGRVALLVDSEELLIYDLASGEVVKTIAMPGVRSYIAGFDEGRVLMKQHTPCDDPGICDSANSLVVLVDINTGEMSRVPEPPGAENAGYWDLLLSGRQIAAQLSTCTAGDPVGWWYQSREDFLVFDIAAGQWRLVTRRDAGDPYPLFIENRSEWALAGMDEQYLLLVHWHNTSRDAETRLELVDVTSGESRTIGQQQGFGMDFDSSTSMLRNGRVIWIDPLQAALFAYDVATGQQQRISLSAVTRPED